MYWKSLVFVRDSVKTIVHVIADPWTSDLGVECSPMLNKAMNSVSRPVEVGVLNIYNLVPVVPCLTFSI